jgi:acetyl-CoA/propionyl-CoA carboxylase, biotin carboxylase, biotin carboxyl carrier protein
VSAVFASVLVANRGEIAVRVIRTLRRLGIRSVAVWSDADAGALHVRQADVAVRIGPAPAKESYLNIGRIIEAAQSTGAEAVHPGFGFLAENAAFAQACTDAGLAWVGPSPHAIEVMGDKISAKLAVGAAGVPVVPGRAVPDMTDADLTAAAEEIGYPVLVKPSAGGGGKGMRVVTAAVDLPDALRSGRREALASFGDGTLFVERYVDRPRHIEVQILADTQGRTVHLGERECTLQRRHQKVVEEAPSPLLDDATRARIGGSACSTAESVGYVGAGTVEFIVGADRPDEYFFMEMNTRLQVEHPVTELVTGLDLVEQQLRIAAGEPLGFDQADVVLRGHAVEARVYAEDPARAFLPTGGKVLALAEPTGQGIRVDSGLTPGLEVGTTYDPMLSKVIAWGADRDTALGRLHRALADTAVLGVVTNVTFLRALVAHPDVKAGNLDTGLIERHLPELVADATPDVAYATYALTRLADTWPAGPIIDPWDVPNGWRLGGSRPLTLLVAADAGGTLALTVRGTPDEAWVGIGDATDSDGTDSGETGDAIGHGHGEEVPASIDGSLVTYEDTSHRVLTATAGSTIWVAVDGGVWAISEARPTARAGAAGAADADIRSPMPGTVIAANVAGGDQVTAGQTVLVIEAMKMEHGLVAPFDGLIELLVDAGDQVALDQVVARVTAEASEESS